MGAGARPNCSTLLSGQVRPNQASTQLDQTLECGPCSDPGSPLLSLAASRNEQTDRQTGRQAGSGGVEHERLLCPVAVQREASEKAGCAVGMSEDQQVATCPNLAGCRLRYLFPSIGCARALFARGQGLGSEVKLASSEQ